MLTEAEATRLTTRIHLLLGPHLDQRDKLVSMVTEAREGDAHLALGYRSWTAYVSEQFGDLLPRLARTERLPFVELMAEEGMSTRAIAAVVHTSHQTVANDLNSAGVKTLTPDDSEIVDAAIVEGVEDDFFFTNEQFETALADAKAGDDLCREKAARKQITGRDGKTYTAQVPRAPRRRRPLPEAYRDTSYALLKSAQSLSRLHQDDRFTANREAVQHHGNELARVANELDALLDDLGIDRHKYGRAL